MSLPATYSPREERLNIFTHALGLVLIVPLGVWLVSTGKNKLGDYAVPWLLIYAVGIAMLFGSSVAYHLAKNPLLRLRLRLLDHVCIYVSIAATYTPFLALGIANEWRFLALWAVWGVAFCGIGYKLIFKHKYPRLSLFIYLLQGWMAIWFIVPFLQQLPRQSLWFIAFGGFFYSLGAWFYSQKHREFTHAIWHVCVMAGVGCHFWAVWRMV